MAQLCAPPLVLSWDADQRAYCATLPQLLADQARRRTTYKLQGQGQIFAGEFNVPAFSSTGKDLRDPGPGPAWASALADVFVGAIPVAGPALLAARTAFQTGTAIEKGAPILPVLGSGILDLVSLYAPTPAKGKTTMGLFDDILGGFSSFGSAVADYLPSPSQFLSAAVPIATAYLTPQPAARPVSQNLVPYQFPQAPPTYNGAGAALPVSAGMIPAGAIAMTSRPILFKMASYLGTRSIPSLQTAMRWIRSMGKYMAPTAIATSLGITAVELATLITANSRRRHRRMNPANAKALRRAARRLESFHKLCARTDVLRSRGRRRSAGGRCGTCKKSPCRC